LVKAATGEVVTAEDLGGADVHCRVSGVTDHMAEDDAHALSITRTVVNHLNMHQHQGQQQSEGDGAAPVYDMEELGGVIPVDARKPFDVREVIARVVDGSRFHEFKKNYGNTVG
jgi:3-methylcrotonyl-CoA carboxylase beta subunit